MQFLPAVASIPTQSLRVAQPVEGDGHCGGRTDDDGAFPRQWPDRDRSGFAHRLGKDKLNKTPNRPSRQPP
jgi:hypothetical protein